MKLQSNILEEFNEFSKNYTDDMVACVPHYRELLSGFIDHLPKELYPKQILDLGCGNGNVTRELLKKFPKAQYTLLDASDKMLELCEKQFNQYHISTVQSYFQDFEFKNHQFDMVAAGFSIHHCNKKDKQSLFKNIYDSLNHNGMFSCSDLMIDRASTKHLQLIKEWEEFVRVSYPNSDKWDWLMDHYNEYDNPDSLNNHLLWLDKAGFKDFKVTIHNTYWVHLKAFKK